jgi:hypothetical protein
MQDQHARYFVEPQSPEVCYRKAVHALASAAQALDASYRNPNADAYPRWLELQAALHKAIAEYGEACKE